MQLVDKDKNIIISQGDVLNVPFKLNGLTLATGDTIYFSVKQRLGDDVPVITYEVNNIDFEANRFAVVIPTAIMETLNVGQYYYDITLVNEDGNKRTLNYPNKLIIKEVAHNDNFNN